MKPKGKNKKTDPILQYYLDELSQIKLTDKKKLKRLHSNLQENNYYNQDIYNIIIDNIFSKLEKN